MKKILIVLTNHATLGETNEANGTYSPELTHALDVFLKAGYEYTLASIAGGQAPLYGTDIEGDEVNTRILADETFKQRITNTRSVAEVESEDFDAVFYPGGFGLLSDLANNEQFAAVTA